MGEGNLRAPGLQDVIQDHQNALQEIDHLYLEADTALVHLNPTNKGMTNMAANAKGDTASTMNVAPTDETTSFTEGKQTD